MLSDFLREVVRFVVDVLIRPVLKGGCSHRFTRL